MSDTDIELAHALWVSMWVMLGLAVLWFAIPVSLWRQQRSDADRREGR